MSKILCGNEMDRMPDWAFRMMSFMFSIQDLFTTHGKKLELFSIQKGSTVVDYGSGTGRFLKAASELAGETGTVYAVDIHELATEAAFRQKKKYNLKNVIPVCTSRNDPGVPSHCADLIYALDMFHMIGNPLAFLKELHRIVKDDGVLIIEDGHQPRSLAKEKILKSGIWEIQEENKSFMKCKPKKQ